MSKWKQIYLNECVELNMGQSPSSSTYNTLGNGIPFFQGNADFGEITPNVKYFCSEPIKIANKGDLLISVRAPIGALNFASEKCCIGRGLCSLSAKNCCNIKYLFYILQYKKSELNAKGTGSTFKAINKQSLSETKIPLPPLEEQHKIASILDTVSEALKLRKQQLNELDLLVKSKFVEMFGDPVINRKSWKTVALNKIGVIKSGGTPKREHTEYFNGSIPWITTIALGPNIINISNAVEYITQEAIDNSATKIIPSNSLLLGMRVGVGKTSINAVPMCTNQDIIAITKINQNLFNLLYLKKVIDMYSGYFNYQKRGATIKGINNRILKAVLVPITPIELQNKFASFVEHVDELKSEGQKSIDQLQTLFDSLMQQYFE